MNTNILLLVSLVSSILSWLIPLIIQHTDPKKFIFSTISYLGIGKYKYIYNTFIAISGICLSLHIYFTQSIIATSLSVLLTLSLIGFLTITIKKDILKHNSFGMTFFILLTIAPTLLDGISKFTMLQIVLLVLAYFQIYFKKGNAISVILVCITATIALWKH